MCWVAGGLLSPRTRCGRLSRRGVAERDIAVCTRGGRAAPVLAVLAFAVGRGATIRTAVLVLDSECWWGGADSSCEREVATWRLGSAGRPTRSSVSERTVQAVQVFQPVPGTGPHRHDVPPPTHHPEHQSTTNNFGKRIEDKWHGGHAPAGPWQQVTCRGPRRGKGWRKHPTRRRPTCCMSNGDRNHLSAGKLTGLILSSWLTCRV